MQGYIKVSRAILYHPSLQKKDRSLCEIGAFIWLLLEASFKDRDFDIKGQTVKLKRGQLCCSISYMANNWNWKKAKAQRYLDRLKRNGTILSNTPTDTSADMPNIITICHYDEYQDTPYDTPKDKKQNKLKRINDKNVDEFLYIWGKLDAKRGSKKVAMQKYNKIKNKVDKDILIEKYNQIVKKASSIEFIPHFSTFLSQERWLDDDQIIKQKVMTHEDWFRSRFPDILDQDWTMLSYSYPEIVFINRKGNKLAYDMRDGTPIS